MRRLAIIALLAAAACGGDSAFEAPSGAIFDDYGGPTEIVDDGVDRVWLTLWDPDVRFSFPREPEARRLALESLVRRAGDGLRAVNVSYDAARGRLNRETGTLDYPLCAVSLDKLQVESSPSCQPGKPAPPPTPEAALALARAHAVVGNGGEALAILERPAMPSDSDFRRLFLRVRAQAQQTIMEKEAPASPAADRASLARLADYRELAKLDPDDVDLRLGIATILADLGAYAEAFAELDAIIAKWPGEQFRVAIRRGALHRMQGHHQAALHALDSLAAREGPQAGMKFHYHRAWTLSLLGRHDEAVAELDEGLKDQPDYPSAFLRRACAYAGLGRIRRALDDVTEAARLYAALPGAAQSALVRDDIEELAAMRRRLEAALAAGSDKPVAGTCAGPNWASQERPRPRSALLASR